jgi:acid phosphatase (class A)
MLARKKTILRYGGLLALGCVLVLAGCSTPEQPSGPAAAAEIAPGLLEGYLPADDLPNSLLLAPPPPVEGSAAFARDEEVSRESFTLRGTKRWDQAIKDADLHFPAAADAFADALGFRITETDTPHLYMLLRRTLTDAGLSTYTAKNHYVRKRPFMVNGQPIGTPDDEEALRNDGSYPSGHTAIGWAWSLILCEIVPERTDAILARGREFGQSRVVCNVHWQSDVDEGRIMGASAVARLHADEGFLADLNGAKAEVQCIRAEAESSGEATAWETGGLVRPGIEEVAQPESERFISA